MFLYMLKAAESIHLENEKYISVEYRYYDIF
jgi:hypothetical protein